MINYLKEICKRIFQRGFNILPVKIREGKIQTYILRIDSKSICKLIESVFKIPSGKKSDIVAVPFYISNANKNIKIAFLKGIMATEGGKRKRGFGLSTASKRLWEDLIYLFNNINISISRDKWTHKKYKKNYYGISFNKKYISLLRWECQSGQMNRA